jgi:ubiquinone/menaquinone biosynthesis C-methylase UbiE
VRYVAIDIDEKMLARSRARATRRGLSRVEFVAADMLALPFDDGEVDLMLSYSGLHMVNDPEQAVREFARCLKSDGRLRAAKHETSQGV